MMILKIAVDGLSATFTVSDKAQCGQRTSLREVHIEFASACISLLHIDLPLQLVQWARSRSLVSIASCATFFYQHEYRCQDQAAL